MHCSIVVELCISGGIDVTHIIGNCASMFSRTTLPSFMLHDFVFCLFVALFVGALTHLLMCTQTNMHKLQLALCGGIYTVQVAIIYV